jgi:hypothetical protein
MSKRQPTRSGALDFSYDLLTTVVLNRMKNDGDIDDFKGSKEKAKIKRPGTKSYTKAVSKTNEKFLKKKIKQKPQLFQGKPEEKEKPEAQDKPEEELKDKPSDIARQKAKAEEEAKARAEAEAKANAEEENHPINRLARQVGKERNPIRKKILLRKLRELDSKTNNADKPKKYVTMKGVLSKAKKQRDTFQKTFLKKKDNKIDSLSVDTSAFMEDIEDIIKPTEENQPLLYFIAAAINRDPEKVIAKYIADPLAYITKLRTDFKIDIDEDDREIYNTMAEKKINYSDITPEFIRSQEREEAFVPKPEEAKPEEAKSEEPKREQRQFVLLEAARRKALQEEAKREGRQFGLPEGAPRQALQEEAKRLVEVPPETGLRRRRGGDVAIDIPLDIFERDLEEATSDDEKKTVVDRFMQNPQVQRAARGVRNSAEFVNLFRNSPAWQTMSPIVKDLLLIAATSYFTAKLQSGGETEIDETDPVKVEAELRRLREQLTNLRTAKLNEESEEQPFKTLRKFRPEIREFNPERLNYFISAENEELEKKELVNFAYIPEVSQAGVYTEDYKDNPLVMGNIQNENIRYSNTIKQPMDYHPVGTYMLLDRIGKQMSEIRRDFSKAVASMKYQQRADDGMFNQVSIPRIPPVEFPRNRRYRDMGDPVSKFASEPIVSLPKIDYAGVGSTSAQRDFTTSYSYRRHYIK